MSSFVTFADISLLMACGAECKLAKSFGLVQNNQGIAKHEAAQRCNEIQRNSIKILEIHCYFGSEFQVSLHRYRYISLHCSSASQYFSSEIEAFESSCISVANASILEGKDQDPEELSKM